MSYITNEDWHEARLIPIHGITSGKEAENRASSALLAVMKGVPDFAIKIFEDVKTPKIKINNLNTYIQTPFPYKGEKFIPDGIITVKGYGNNNWGALVEVKTGTDKLEVHQLEAYIRIAEEQGFNTLITISNEISPVIGQHPYRALLPETSIELIHLSWAYIGTQAAVLKEYLGIDDREQDWILSEFIRYIESDKSGVQDFNDMGSQWGNQLENVRNSVFDKHSDEAKILVTKLMSLASATTLKLTASSGRKVHTVFSKENLKSEELRIEEQLNNLATEGAFKTVLKVEGTYSPIYVEVNIGRKQIICSTYLDVPDTRTEIRKAGWFMKQVAKLESPIRIKAKFKHGRKGDGITLSSSTITNPEQLLEEGKKIVSFKMSISSQMGEGRTGKGRNSFIQSFYEALNETYDNLILKIKPYEEPLTPIRTAPAKAEETSLLIPEKVDPWVESDEVMKERSTEPKTEPITIVPATATTVAGIIPPPPVFKSNLS